MATTMPWGEEIEVRMAFGFPTGGFTLGDERLGVLGTGILSGSLEGDDVSSFCQQITITRGRSDQLQNFNAGTCRVQLKNFDRRFDPINENSPYWNPTTNQSGVTPRRRVTITSGSVPLFTGRVTDIDIEYEPVPPGATQELSYATITAADDFVLLANTFTEDAITPTEQASGARVEAILDLPEIAYPLASRDISTGVAVLGGGATFDIPANTNALTYLQNVATAESNFFYVAANGDLTFTDRIGTQFVTNPPFFSDDGTGIPYQNLQVLFGQEFLYNKVVVSAVGGTDQIANDVASQTEYGISTLSLGELLLSDDTQAAELADILLNRYSQPEYRFDRMRVLYNGRTSPQQTTLTAIEIGDPIAIKRSYATGSPASVEKNYSIEQLVHTITAQSHHVEFMLSPAEIVFPLILGDAEYGTLGTLNALGAKTYLPFFMDEALLDSGYSFTA